MASCMLCSSWMHTRTQPMPFSLTQFPSKNTMRIHKLITLTNVSIQIDTFINYVYYHSNEKWFNLQAFWTIFCSKSVSALDKVSKWKMNARVDRSVGRSVDRCLCYSAHHCCRQWGRRRRRCENEWESLNWLEKFSNWIMDLIIILCEFSSAFNL